ncbi:MAG: TrkH family potassium uptake protein [Clostridiales bacterium]|nr:TrkH family potassium uptake protein [Clostridiales bacterium]
MNYKKIGKILGKIMIMEGILMFAPLLVSLIYRETARNVLAFVIPALVLVGIGFLLQIPKSQRETLYQKEGFALVAVSWIVMSLFGAIPFVINREIPNYINACFEIMSGFTTTGASILEDVTLLSHSSLFWRSFSHWIGGMGILVFILIFIPESKEGSSMHLLRAESPGPQVGKLVSKMKVTTRILYLIYAGLTVLEIVLLMLDKPVAGYEKDKYFFSILTAFGSAGTGGFGMMPGSMELMNPYSQYVIAVFLLLFGCNFTIYYLLLIGKIKHVLKSEELRTYFGLVFVAVLVVFLSVYNNLSAMPQISSGEEAFRHSLFQVASLISTTGFSTTDFNVWPSVAQTVLILLMFTGAMAGSTAGGMKLSRIVIAFKGMYVNVRKTINPRYVPKTKFEGKVLEEKTTNSVLAFITLYVFILMFTVLVLSFDPINQQAVTVTSDAGVYTVQHGFFSNFSAALACISNIGPGFEAVGPYASYVAFSPLSKIVLMLTMLVGRLEILPVLILFTPKTYRKS